MGLDYEMLGEEEFYSLYIRIPDVETHHLLIDRLVELGYSVSGVPDPQGVRIKATYIYITKGKNQLTFSSGQNIYLNSNEISIGGSLATLYTRDFLDNYKFQ